MGPSSLDCSQTDCGCKVVLNNGEPLERPALDQLLSLPEAIESGVPAGTTQADAFHEKHKRQPSQTLCINHANFILTIGGLSQHSLSSRIPARTHSLVHPPRFRLINGFRPPSRCFPAGHICGTVQLYPILSLF